MAKTQSSGGIKEFESKPYSKMIITGIISIIFYIALFTQQSIINNYFSKGSFFALLPIATAFLFSFTHGAFTGSFWTVLGIKEKK